MKFTTYLLGLNVLLCSSCMIEIERKDLFGRWDYIKVKNFNPQDSLTSAELNKEKPAIIFSADSNLLIEWGGKQLSKGTFRMEGKLIRYTEFLEGGNKREFPFIIKQLTDKELVFETMDQNPTQVTAIRAK